MLALEGGGYECNQHLFSLILCPRTICHKTTCHPDVDPLRSLGSGESLDLVNLPFCSGVVPGFSLLFLCSVSYTFITIIGTSCIGRQTLSKR